MFLILLALFCWIGIIMLLHTLIALITGKLVCFILFFIGTIIIDTAGFGLSLFYWYKKTKH